VFTYLLGVYYRLYRSLFLIFILLNIVTWSYNGKADFVSDNKFSKPSGGDVSPAEPDCELISQCFKGENK